jgi:hypothetical protein
MNETQKSKRFDEIVGKPIMTAKERIELMKRKREAEQNEVVSLPEELPLSEQAPLLSTMSEDETPKTAVLLLGKKKKSKALTYDVLLDSFRPKEVEMPRIQCSTHLRQDAWLLQRRILNILGGVGAKHCVGNIKFYVSLSAFHNHLILSFFESHKEEIEALEQQQQSQGQLQQQN